MHRRDFIAFTGAIASAWQSALADERTPATTAGPKILVVGDSLSAEYGIARGSGWVALLQRKLADQHIAATVVNASISGDTTSGGRARLPALLKEHEPDIVIIELGSNDALRGLPLEETKANLIAMAQAAESSGARVLLLGMQIPPNYGGDYMRRFSAVFGEAAGATKSALVPFLLAGVADGPNASDLFQADRLHPLAKAHPRILENVWPTLQDLLAKQVPAR